MCANVQSVLQRYRTFWSKCLHRRIHRRGTKANSSHSSVESTTEGENNPPYKTLLSLTNFYSLDLSLSPPSLSISSLPPSLFSYTWCVYRMLSTPVNVLTERLNYVKRCKVKLFVNTDAVCLLFQYLKLDLQKHLVYTNMRTLFLGHWERHVPRCAL